MVNFGFVPHGLRGAEKYLVFRMQSVISPGVAMCWDRRVAGRLVHVLNGAEGVLRAQNLPGLVSAARAACAEDPALAAGPLGRALAALEHEPREEDTTPD